MVSIGEDDLRVELLERFVRRSFYRRKSAHRHEDGGFDLAVRRDEFSAARGSIAGRNREVQHWPWQWKSQNRISHPVTCSFIFVSGLRTATLILCFSIHFMSACSRPE